MYAVKWQGLSTLSSGLMACPDDRPLFKRTVERLEGRLSLPLIHKTTSNAAAPCTRYAPTVPSYLVSQPLDLTAQIAVWQPCSKEIMLVPTTHRCHPMSVALVCKRL